MASLVATCRTAVTLKSLFSAVLSCSLQFLLYVSSAETPGITQKSKFTGTKMCWSVKRQSASTYCYYYNTESMCTLQMLFTFSVRQEELFAMQQTFIKHVFIEHVLVTLQWMWTVALSFLKGAQTSQNEQTVGLFFFFGADFRFSSHFSLWFSFIWFFFCCCCLLLQSFVFSVSKESKESVMMTVQRRFLQSDVFSGSCFGMLAVRPAVAGWRLF